MQMRFQELQQSVDPAALFGGKVYKHQYKAVKCHLISVLLREVSFSATLFPIEGSLDV